MDVVLIGEFRPVGNRVLLKGSLFDESVFAPFSFIGFDCGTSALAAALIAVRRVNSDISHPQVMIPAYTCPDIISACLYAKVTPVLVDFEEDTPFLNLIELSEKITRSCIAIIAINFMGIPERISKIKKVIGKLKITVIEDSAQGFPKEEVTQYWRGDIVITSFGRGKPINLMGGGGLFYNRKNLPKSLIKGLEFDWLSETNIDSANCFNDSEKNNKNTKDLFEIKRNKPLFKKLSYQLKAVAFNFLSSPIPFYFIARLPGIGLGTTTYRPLEKILPLPSFIKKVFFTNYSIFRNSKNNRNNRRQYDGIFDEITDKSCINLSKLRQLKFNTSLLRYPVLIKDKKQRLLVLSKLQAQRLGISIMYKSFLPAIEGIEDSMYIAEGDFVNARNLADELVTFPIHDDVKAEHIKDIEKVIFEVLG